MAKNVNKFDIPSEDTMVDNIRKIYAQATDFDMRSGLDWYVRTRQFCQAIADYYGHPLENVVGAYAVISPSLDKEMNDSQIVMACFYHALGIPLETINLGVYGARNRIKAERCLNGDLSVVSGDKVSRFYRNIIGTGDMDVTVDRWALRVALDNPEIKDTQGLTKAGYQKVHGAYVKASKIMGLLPLQAQAVTWEVLRNKYYKKSGDVNYK